MDITKLPPMPWTVRPLPHDNWGTVRDDTGCVVLNTITAMDIAERKHLGEFNSPEHKRGPERAATVAEWVVLAAAAWDVMMRRGWSASIDLQSDDPRKWYAVGIDCSLITGTKEFPYHDNLFTVLVEADKWHKANIEEKQP